MLTVVGNGTWRYSKTHNLPKSNAAFLGMIHKGWTDCKLCDNWVVRLWGLLKHDMLPWWLLGHATPGAPRLKGTC